MLLLKELLIPHRRIFQTAILYVFARLILPILAVLISPLGQGIHFISYVLSAPFLPVRLLVMFLSLWSTPEGVVTHDGGLYDLVLFGQVVLDLLILYILCGGIVYLYEKQKKALLYTSVVLFVVLPLVCQLFFILALHCSPSVDNPAKPLIAEVPRSTLVRYAELREISALSTLTIQKCKRFTDGYLRYAISTTTNDGGRNIYMKMKVKEQVIGTTKMQI